MRLAQLPSAAGMRWARVVAGRARPVGANKGRSAKTRMEPVPEGAAWDSATLGKLLQHPRLRAFLSARDALGRVDPAQFAPQWSSGRR